MFISKSHPRTQWQLVGEGGNKLGKKLKQRLSFTVILRRFKLFPIYLFKEGRKGKKMERFFSPHRLALPLPFCLPPLYFSPILLPQGNFCYICGLILTIKKINDICENELTTISVYLISPDHTDLKKEF